MPDPREFERYPVRHDPASAVDRSWDYGEHEFSPDPLVDQDEGPAFSFSRYTAALMRYKWIVLVAVLLGAGGAYGAWTFIQPEYVARGSLWIQSTESEGQGPIAAGGLLESYSWVELLNSFTVLDSVVRSERLYLRPSRPADLELFDGFELASEFAPGSYTLVAPDDGGPLELVRDGTIVDRAEPGEEIGESLGFRWTLPAQALPPGEEASFTVTTPRDAAIRLRDGALSTQMDQAGNFLSIEIRGENPVRIASVLNAIMERHVALAADLKSGSLRERTNALEEQLAYVEEELVTAEQDLEAFRIQTITLPSDASPIQPGLEMTRDPVFANYFQMQIEIDELRRQQDRLEQVMEQVAGGTVPIETLELIPAAAGASELQDALTSLREARSERRLLLQQYTPEHPPVRELEETIAALEDELIPSLLQSLLEGLEQQESVLAARIESAGSELSDIPPRTIEEARLNRRVAIAEELYGELRNRYETASLAESSTIPDVRILDRATVPEVPANDERVRFALVIFAGAIGLGLLMAILMDRFDPRVRYPDEVGRQFGLPFLGVIPTIPKPNGRKSRTAARQAYEAFRELRTNLSYAYGASGPIVLAISSPGQGDGKSAISANLALAFAHEGRKTLLIDGDTRRGRLHRTMNVDRKPGLTDFLRSTEPMPRLVRRTEHDNLHLITAGSRLSNSPELLSSDRLASAIGRMKSRFEVIIVDTPPLAAGSDAAVLSCLTGHLMLVLRSGSTHREFALTKLKPFSRLPVRILGVVLNDYTPRGVGAYSYYGNYLPGYETGLGEGNGSEDEESHEPLSIGPG